MTAAILLDRLERVRQTGADRWIARCPSHEDRTPSLSIRETDDGTILLKCFAGCGAAGIVAAVGMELRDLFPPRGDYHRPPTRHRVPAADRLALIDGEALTVCVIASDLARGEPLTEEVRERLHTAARRIGEARDDSQN